MTRIALRDRVDLDSIMIPVGVVAKNNKQQIFKCFWKKQNLVRPNQECDRGHAVKKKTYVSFFLCISWKNAFDLVCLNKLVFFVDFKSEEDRLFHIFGLSRTGIFGHCYFCEMESLV